MITIAMIVMMIRVNPDIYFIKVIIYTNKKCLILPPKDKQVKNVYSDYNLIPTRFACNRQLDYNLLFVYIIRHRNK